MTNEEAGSRARNVGVWIGLGCLGIFILSCCLLGFWAQAYGWRWILRQGDDTKIWASRMILVGALESARKSCRDGTIGEDAAPWFHPDVPSATRDLACTLDRASLRALGDAELAPAVPLGQSEQAELAARFGMDPGFCFRHATEAVRAVGCFDPEGGTGSIPYQIIDLALEHP
jgi:hypothetical protein